MWRHHEHVGCVSRLSQLALCLSWTLIAAISGGCNRNDGPERVVVSGVVTYQGKPIPEGNIRFVPMASSTTPMSGAIITDGKYRAEGNRSIPVGTHKVQIEAYRVMPGPVPPVARGVPRIQYLPSRCNTGSQLQIVIEPGSREITKNFDLTD